MTHFEHDDSLSNEVLALAKRLTLLAHQSVDPTLMRRLERRHLFLNDTGGIRFLTHFLDACYHTASSKNAMSQFRKLLAKGLPKGMPWYDQFLFCLAVYVGFLCPKTIYRAMLFYSRFQVQDVLFFYGSKLFDRFIRRRASEGVLLNFNKLGEAVLSDEEADVSFQDYKMLLGMESVQYMSVKLSALSCHIDPLNWDETHADLSSKFSELLRLSVKRNPCVFITLDMESYVELPLTVSVFQSVLSEKEFQNVSAGIALQAYLSESFEYQKHLTSWAMERVNCGGAPIKIRLVKGANLAMEHWQSASKNWPLPVFSTKLETDAQYKKMMAYALQKEHLVAVHIGVGSHNVFDIAYAITLREKLGIEPSSLVVMFELLEGMAPGLMQALKALGHPVLSYCPVTKETHFRAGLAYLVRRLDEQTAKYHIIKDFIHLYPDTPLWESYEEHFLASLNTDVSLSKTGSSHDFLNYPDTQWHLLKPTQIHLFVCDQVMKSPVVCATYSPTQFVDIAESVLTQWASSTVEARMMCCDRLTMLLEEQKSSILSLMVFEGKKILREADAEFSEAMDFIRYYKERLRIIHEENPEVRFNPKGIVVVTPPWNFPFAIPLGGVLAALLMGNVVIFKPAPEAKRMGVFMAQLFWEAGFPKDVLQCAVFDHDEDASILIKDTRVSTVVLTGASQTASLFLSWRPDLHLLAETGGKNTMIVSSFSDKDLVIQDVIHSAFGHAGQKCSALSLLILYKDLYDDEAFLERLKAAVQSLNVGEAHEVPTQVPPLIRPPSQALYRELTSLDDGQSWLLKPQQLSADLCLWSPGIKLGVKPDSFFYKTECFGPVLGVMRAHSMQEAITLANGTAYGLTAGLHSLDSDEQTLWLSKIQAGNLYINRAITGALVHRQPFGGWKLSKFGYGFKAGGPYYLLGFADLSLENVPRHSEQLILQDVQTWSDYYLSSFQQSRFYGQENRYRFVGYSSVTIRVFADITFEALIMALYAACFTAKRVYLSVSHPISLQSLPRFFHHANLQVVVETLDDCVIRLSSQDDALLRVASPQFLSVVGRGKFVVSKDPILLNAKFEILKYLKEQSVSHTTHRYGL